MGFSSKNITPYFYLALPVTISICLALLTQTARNFEIEYTLIQSWIYLLIAPPFLLFSYKKEWISRSHILHLFFLYPLISTILSYLFYFVLQCSCSLNGLTFWLLINPFISSLYIHLFCLLLLQVKRPNYVFIAMLLSIFLSLFLLWIFPQKRIMHPILGFLHGPIYDAAIPFNTTMIQDRLLQALYPLFAIAILLRVKRNLFSLLTVITMIYHLSVWPQPSTSVGKKNLEKAFHPPWTHSTFKMYFSKSLQISIRNKQELYYETQFHIAALQALAPSSIFSHVHIYIYKNNLEKKIYFGGGGTDITDVYTPSVHINSHNSPHPTLRHELVHGLFSRDAFHGLGFHPNMALTEGLAVALAPSRSSVELDVLAGSLLKKKRIPNIKSLFGPLFWLYSGARAYTSAGSFITHLIDHFSLDQVLKFYSGNSFLQSFGKPLETEIQNWKNKIRHAYETTNHGIYTESLFRSRGILFNQCPHTKSDYQTTLSKDPTVQWRRSYSFKPKDYIIWKENLSKQNSLLNKTATQLSPFWRSRSKPKAEIALKILNDLQLYPKKKPKNKEDIDLVIIKSDLQSLLKTSSTDLKSLLNFGIGAAQRRGILARIWSQQLPLHLRQPIRSYLSGFSNLHPSIDLQEPWLITYLKLRKGTDPKLQDPKFLAQLTKLPPLPNPYFSSEWHRLLAGKAMASHDYTLAAKLYNKAGLQNKGSRKLYNQLKSLAIYFSTQDFSKDS